MVDWHNSAWFEYNEWQSIDRNKMKRINLLIKEILRHPFDGAGKPEPLKGTLSGFWSRRIDDEHRLVYRVTGDVVEIAQCRGHY